MQTQATGQVSLAAAVQKIAARGPLEVYKGMGAPLATVAAFNAILFSTWGAAERLILGPGGGQMTAGQAAVAGAIAGIPVSLLATPTELIKCRLQQQAGQAPPPGRVYSAADYSAGKMLYRGPVDVLQAAVRFEGPLAAMRGLAATLLREVPGKSCSAPLVSVALLSVACSLHEQATHVILAPTN